MSINQKSKIINHKLQKGFTLVELLLYMGIFSILLLVLMQLFTSILNVHLESQSTSSVFEDGNYILSRLSYDIHQGNSIISPSSGVLTIDGNTYSLSGNNFTINSDQLNSANTTVSGISFKILTNPVIGSKPSVQIVMTLKSKIVSNGGNQTRVIQETVNAR